MANPNSILPTPAEMISHLNRFVRGQTRAKQDIAVAIYNHYLSQAYFARHGSDLGSHHILMLGPTGSGKTYIVKTLAEYLGVPFSINSAASLVEAGYKGRSVEDIVRPLLERGENNPKLAEKGIIFLDEIDKIRRQETGGRDVSGEGVQNALLTLLDGRIVSNIDMRDIPPLDTRRILFVCTGAFVGLQEIVDKRLGLDGKRLGFHARPNEQLDKIPDDENYRSLCQTQTGDLVTFGMIPEFIGRFATITTLHELSRDDLRAIISNSTHASPLAKQQELARIHGIQLEITDDALDLIAAEAQTLGTGARGLHRLIGRAVDSVDHRWPELAEQGISRVVIDQNSIKTGAEPQLISEPRSSQRIDLELRRECLAIIPRSPSPFIKSSHETSTHLPNGITDTRGWTDEEVWNRIEEIKNETLAWPETSGSARSWWESFEAENKHRAGLILRLAEELANRQATISEFFLAYVYSNCDNIQANLHYLDFTRLKKEEENRKRKP